MKTLLVPAVFALTVFTFASCDNNQSTETRTDSLTTGSSTSSNEVGTDASQPASSTGSASSEGSSSVSEGSYINLSTGKTVTVKRDESTGYAWDATLNEPIEFYISPSTRDTFDRMGRVVSNYLIHSSEGKYMIDEQKWKTRIDSDGDMKAKDGEGNKIKYDASSGSLKTKSADGSKEKLKDDKYKSKTDTSKTVIKNQ
jgi:hypothetical protein